ncbi:hypothetical protein H2199_001285 [Coniosporium tulheliwenetii]|uniref:Uncharacterized protein n=1 Tax=Coniosporium tulheliwenetii TaxID=3383036 RepID=A0ACC2ZLR5_9PEZI|nr:hypothetical protein H2199_001285 [Cladosporium sp. JES 115]
MERELKRKAPPASSPGADGRPTKRQRLPGNGSTAIETTESTTEAGLRFIESMKQAKDKTGRPIATSFLTLPDKNVVPEYYERIRLPIALDTIEAKLNRREYPNLSAVESDLKRMVTNAKSYNEKSSLLFEDAERIRKTASNWMVKHNPAYNDADYIAVATPIPEELLNGSTPLGASGGAAVHDSGGRLRRGAAASSAAPQTPASRPKKPPGVSGEREPSNVDAELVSKTFMEAQDQIVEEIIKYKEPESGLEIFQPFVNLPPRSLTDYYHTIKNPVSLKGVQKRVRGVHGRNPPTWKTDLKTWDAFEQEFSMIWKNARLYNEDGSDIYNLSIELEEFFNTRLAEAKSKVQEPPKMTMKLNMSAAAPSKPTIKLRLKPSPAPQPGSGPGAARNSATPGVMVDSGALERQKLHVKAGMNGHRPPPPRLRRLATPVQRDWRFSPSQVNGVKHEAPAGQSPALGAIRPSSTAPDTVSDGRRTSLPAQTPQLASAAMPPPPSVTPRPPSSSPHPHPSHLQQGYQYHPSYAAPPPGLANKYRAPGKTAADALLPNVRLSAHPGLKLARDWKLDIPASPELTQQSITLTLPSTHYFIQISPTIPVALTSRAFKIFVTVNHNRLYEVTKPDRVKGKPLYEGRLEPGKVNRIEVEVVAEAAGASARGSPVKAGGSRGRS